MAEKFTTTIPSPPTPKELIDGIDNLLTKGYRFSNAEMDVLIEVPMRMIPPGDRQIIREVAVQNKCPLWQAVIAQFRRTNEQGYAYALLLDPGWIQEESTREDLVECPECKEIFVPKNPGQKFCGNECGAAEEKRRMAQIVAKAAEAEANTPNIPVTEASSEAPAPPIRREDRGIVPIGAEAIAREIRN